MLQYEYLELKKNSMLKRNARCTTYNNVRVLIVHFYYLSSINASQNDENNLNLNHDIIITIHPTYHTTLTFEAIYFHYLFLSLVLLHLSQTSTCTYTSMQKPIDAFFKILRRWAHNFQISSAFLIIIIYMIHIIYMNIFRNKICTFIKRKEAEMHKIKRLPKLAILKYRVDSEPQPSGRLNLILRLLRRLSFVAADARN